MHFLRALVVFAALLLTACQTGRSDADDADFVFVYLKSGPTPSKTAAERAEVQRGHMANINRLAEERKLIVAGPYGEPRRSQSYRGIFVFDVPDVAEARALAATDPGSKAGVFVMEPHAIRASSALRDTLDLDARMRAEIVASGQTPDFTNSLRSYVIVETQDEKGVRQALGGRRVVFAARMLGAKRGTSLLVVDATDAAALHAELARADSRLRTNSFCEAWWSTKALERLPASAGALRTRAMSAGSTETDPSSD